MSQVASTKIIIKNSWANRMAESILPDYGESEWQWHYEHGLFLFALASIENSHFNDFIQKWIDHFISPSGIIRTYKIEEYNLDQINPGRVLFQFLKRTGESRYEKALRSLRNQLEGQPRGPSGGLWHKRIYPNQMWLDGLYMAEPFNAEYASTFNEPVIYDDITHQFIVLEQHARDPQTGLLYHGWDESKVQKWAHPETGCSPQFWGRAIGWFVMALVDVLDYLPESHPDYPKLVGMLARISQALVRYQDLESGLWYQVVNLPGKPGNYLESSVSAMLVYSFSKAVRKGWLDEEYFSSARRAYHGLLEKMIRLEPDGRLTLQNICGVAGLGGEPYRDGSYEYYIREPVVPNDFKGVGAFILAALEMEKHEAVDTAD